MEEEKIIKLLDDESTRREAFGQIVNQYSETLYWKIRHIVVGHDDANDVLQNTFLNAWKSLDNFRGQSKLSTWLYRIAVNESLDHLRRQHHHARKHGDDLLPGLLFVVLSHTCLL